MGSISTDPTRLESKLGHIFRNRELLADALRHPSAIAQREGASSNQRLEFLGDAVLQLVVSEELFKLDPNAREGVLSRRRASLTKGTFLAELAREIGVDGALELSAAEEQTGGRQRSSILEDALEALVGAIYLDGGLPAARLSVLGWYGPLANRLNAEHGDNPKGRLQELVQPTHGNAALRYDVVDTRGEPHDRHFDVHLHLLNRLIGTGSGRSKKEAEENAAREALRQWKTSAPN
jgi:ribonuclease-3